MVPTPKLRFVEREKKIGSMVVQQKILQQWWNWSIDYPTQSGEWRDVPLEVE